MSQKTERIMIIGAGIGGLSAAIHLAAAGRTVTVLESNPQVGGKMGEVCSAGYRWDTGPSVITMQHVFEDLFQTAGRPIHQYLQWVPVEPLTRYFYPDGVQLDISRDLARTLEHIQALNAADVEGYLRFLAYAARIHRITGPVFIYDQPPSIKSLRKVHPFDVFRFDGLRSMQQAIEGYVRSPHLRQLLGRFATYVGASPFLAPATLNVIAHVELNQGVWYPQSGVYSLAQALAQLSQELGVEIVTNQTVKKIEVRGGRVRGVLLEDQTLLPASAVIANLDVSSVYENLLDSEVIDQKRLRRLQRRELSCSGFILLLGVRAKFPALAHHNIFFSSDYRREFEEIFRQGRPPQEPTIYLAITSKTNPQDAPPGCENWFLLVNAPALGEAWDWEAKAEQYEEQIIEQLAGRGLDIRQHIEVRRQITPLDLQRLTGARAGALYGASSNNRWAAFQRPHNRAPDVKGLYFAGGTTHPGGGVPMVALSGKVASRLLLQDGF